MVILIALNDMDGREARVEAGRDARRLLQQQEV